MMIILKALGIWVLMAIAAIVNGGLRDRVIAKVIGDHIALPLSGVSLSIIILIIVYFTIAAFGTISATTYRMIGLYWLMITVIVEFGFGHYIGGRPWSELFQVLNITTGNLFLLVLIVTTLSPWLVAKLKGLI
ncbi:hypothetical protein [Desulforhopalus sp. IMCC35007]|uniref:hypothetical protein n=1 Tax=Desulforhopalus sp. IMCC35007 TaxID=2569543 RepID=UPI0010AE6662|nr:hypothetical protein [Desulforhopalus sp. IMCC35007]TKB07626.1 hypothetical protein FCL48_16490 [Desulforhopalus sp. IMCC35007]